MRRVKLVLTIHCHEIHHSHAPSPHVLCKTYTHPYPSPSIARAHTHTHTYLTYFPRHEWNPAPDLRPMVPNLDYSVTTIVIAPAFFLLSALFQKLAPSQMMSSAAFPAHPICVSLHDALPETPDLYASPPSLLGMGRQNGYLIAHRRSRTVGASVCQRML